jgi:polyhydroxybutyrate depolymerase
VQGFPDRDFLLRLPPTFDRMRSLPLLIAMHGASGSKEGFDALTCAGGDTSSPSCLSSVAAKEGFLLVYPDGTRITAALAGSRTWNAGGGGTRGLRCEHACKDGVDDVGYFRALLAELAAVVPYDAKRVYLTGFSNGAAMSHRLACEVPESIAAIAPVGGANQFAGASPCSPSRATPVFHIHGEGDPCWPYSGGQGQCVSEQMSSGPYVSVDETIVGSGSYPGWVGRLGCSPMAMLSQAGRHPRDSYGGCRDGATVSRLRVLGAGHTWPGGDQYLSADRIGGVASDLSGSQLVVDFFKSLPAR